MFFYLLSCKDVNKTPDIPTIFGSDFNENTAINFDSLIVKLQSQDSLDVIVEGFADGVCKTKGCWMDLTSIENTNAPYMFVEFEDHKFTLPKEVAGKIVVINGRAYKSIISINDLQEAARQDGNSQEEIDAINAPAVEYSFIASGVKIK